jgi:tripartite-type tricarboxylate transporter receptor subunit TctC
VSLFAASRVAQEFPSRPVTLIVPWPAGGSTDLVMRALATSTEKYLGSRS